MEGVNIVADPYKTQVMKSSAIFKSLAVQIKAASGIMSSDYSSKIVLQDTSNNNPSYYLTDGTWGNRDRPLLVSAHAYDSGNNVGLDTNDAMILCYNVSTNYPTPSAYGNSNVHNNIINQWFNFHSMNENVNNSNMFIIAETDSTLKMEWMNKTCLKIIFTNVGNL